MRAHELGLLAGSPVTPSWCLLYQRDVVMALDPVAATERRLLLWKGGPLSVYYAPVDWVNTAARVMLVGITAGAYQAVELLRAAQACLRAGCSAEETLRRADAAGSFSGSMRGNLITMLDGTARLFDTHHHLAALCSAIDYPVFVNGENYAGRSPQLARHPVLQSLVRACLGTRIAMAPDAPIIPLGKAAEEAVSLLTVDGLVSPGRCLTGFPHPSPGNGHRVRQYAANQAALIDQVARWAAAAAI